MERTVETKYYLVINGAIDRSTCYETTGEARRAAKSVKDGKVMIVVEKFTRDFFEA
jgi:hypothetical protein